MWPVRIANSPYKRDEIVQDDYTFHLFLQRQPCLTYGTLFSMLTLRLCSLALVLSLFSG
jgi:hypothetical protein